MSEFIHEYYLVSAFTTGKNATNPNKLPNA